MDIDLKKISDEELLSLQTLVGAELTIREATWRKKLANLQLARGPRQPPVRQRAVRSDKGKPKTARALTAIEEATGLTDGSAGRIEGRMDNAFVSDDPSFVPAADFEAQ